MVVVVALTKTSRLSCMDGVADDPLTSRTTCRESRESRESRGSRESRESREKESQEGRESRESRESRGISAPVDSVMTAVTVSRFLPPRWGGCFAALLRNALTNTTHPLATLACVSASRSPAALPARPWRTPGGPRYSRATRAVFPACPVQQPLRHRVGGQCKNVWLPGPRGRHDLRERSRRRGLWAGVQLSTRRRRASHRHRRLLPRGGRPAVKQHCPS